MYHLLHVHRPSAVGIILAASDISGPTVLGELPDSVVQWMALDERVTKVQATNVVMFHLAGQKDDEMRRDTSTYQWFGKCARAVVANPYALVTGSKPRTYQIIGRVEPPSAQYPTIRYLRLVLKYVPSTQSSSGTPEIWLQTLIAHTQNTIERSLREAVIVAPNLALHTDAPEAARRCAHSLGAKSQ
jgi:hypothetical protein